MERIPETGGGKRAGVASQNASNGVGTGSIGSTLVDRVLAVGATASAGVATAAGFETIAVQSNALGLGARAAHGVIVKRSNLKSCRAKEIQFVKTLGLLVGRIVVAL